MTAAASHTAGTVRASGCAAGISARRVNDVAGLGSTWATPRRQLDVRACSGPGQRQATSPAGLLPGKGALRRRGFEISDRIWLHLLASPGCPQPRWDWGFS
jgi:hypothetical protein